MSTERRRYSPRYANRGQYPQELSVPYRYRIIAEVSPVLDGSSNRRPFPLFLLSRDRCHPYREADAGIIMQSLTGRIDRPFVVYLQKVVSYKSASWNHELWNLYGYCLRDLTPAEIQELSDQLKAR